MDCEHAYWEAPSSQELHAAKDMALIYPSPVYAAPGLVPPADPQAEYPPGSGTTYAEFAAANARPFAPFTESFKPRCAPATRALAVFEDYPGAFVWHCHLLEHEDSDMMRPVHACAPRSLAAQLGGAADDVCLRPKCLSPATAVAYDVKNGFSAV